MTYAYESLADACVKKLGQDMPSVMSAVAIGNEIFFSSSLRGTTGSDFVYVEMADSEITRDLNRWQFYKDDMLSGDSDSGCSRAMIYNQRNTASTPDRHRLGICGEIFATAMYMNKHDASPRKITGKEGPATVRKARVVAWGGLTDAEIAGGGVAIAWCVGKTDTDQWGCNQFMTYEGFKLPLTDKYKEISKREDPPASETEPSGTMIYGVPIQKLLPASDLMDVD